METKAVSRVPRTVALVAMLAVLLAAALLTPPGRALSQSIVQFFTQADRSAPPLAAAQVAAGDPATVAPTLEPPAPLISVAEAEAQAGMDLAELPYVPDGLNYLGVRIYGGAVRLEYQTEDYAGHLTIKQSQGGFSESNWDQVPTKYVVPVKIGQLDGEFVKGSYVMTADGIQGTWNPTAPLMRLRWIQDGVRFEMIKHGEANQIAYLDQAGMVELAESLVLNE